MAKKKSAKAVEPISEEVIVESVKSDAVIEKLPTVVATEIEAPRLTQSERVAYLVNMEKAARLLCQKYENLAKVYSYPSREDEIKYLEYSRIYNNIVDEIEEIVKNYATVVDGR